MDRPSCDPVALERLRRIGGDSLAGRIVDSFLSTAAERIEALERGRDAQDFPLIERLAHSLKSSAVNVGATELAALADELELRAGQGAAPRMGDLLERIGPVFESARQELVVELELATERRDRDRS